MAKPLIVECAADVWVLVAVNVTSGILHKLNKSPDMFLQTYRETGELAPLDKSEGVLITGDQIQIASIFAIDVYIMAVGVGGSVRLDAEGL